MDASPLAYGGDLACRSVLLCMSLCPLFKCPSWWEPPNSLRRISRYDMESTENVASGTEKNKPLEQSLEDLSKAPPSSVPKSRLTIKYAGPGWGDRGMRHRDPHCHI